MPDRETNIQTNTTTQSQTSTYTEDRHTQRQRECSFYFAQLRLKQSSQKHLLQVGTVFQFWGMIVLNAWLVRMSESCVKC